jgi:cytochrome c553
MPRKTLAHRPLHLAFLILGALAVATAGAAVAGDPAGGRKKAVRCQACHGLDGIAKMPNVPHIAGESELYLTKQLKAFRGGERRDPQMSLMAKNLTDDDIADLAAYYARIEITVRIPDNLR